jgi:dTDP-4-amino-4,6-dideoxy-D-glucose acyltransferase
MTVFHIVCRSLAQALLMNDPIRNVIESDFRARAFDYMRRGEKIPLPLLLKVGLHGAFVEPLKFLMRFMPGPVGLQARIWQARLTMRKFGKNSLIDFGAIIEGPGNISVSDYVWIDRYVELNALAGEIEIGRRVHIAPRVIIAGFGGVYIGDYVGIGANAHILSHSEVVDGGKRMSGPMIPEEMKGMKTAPVRLEKDCVIGTGAVVLPGITIGEGAVVAPNSLVIKNVNPGTIVLGVPARAVSRRAPVTVADI